MSRYNCTLAFASEFDSVTTLLVRIIRNQDAVLLQWCDSCGVDAEWYTHLYAAAPAFTAACSQYGTSALQLAKSGNWGTLSFNRRHTYSERYHAQCRNTPSRQRRRDAEASPEMSPTTEFLPLIGATLLPCAE